MTYQDIINQIKNIREAIDTFYRTGNKTQYLSKSYINSTIRNINTYIDNTKWKITEIDKLHALRLAERNLYGIKRIPEFFIDTDLKSNYQELMNAISDNFVLLPI